MKRIGSVFGWSKPEERTKEKNLKKIEKRNYKHCENTIYYSH